MSYFYQAGKRWRLTLYKNGVKKDIDLGKDRNKALHLRRSIESTLVDEKYAKNLVEDLKELGILAEGTTAGAPAQEVSWKDAVERVLAHMEEIGRRPKTVSDAARSLRKLEEAKEQLRLKKKIVECGECGRILVPWCRVNVTGGQSENNG